MVLVPWVNVCGTRVLVSWLNILNVVGYATSGGEVAKGLAGSHGVALYKGKCWLWWREWLQWWAVSLAVWLVSAVVGGLSSGWYKCRLLFSVVFVCILGAVLVHVWWYAWVSAGVDWMECSDHPQSIWQCWASIWLLFVCCNSGSWLCLSGCCIIACGIYTCVLCFSWKILLIKTCPNSA